MSVYGPLSSEKVSLCLNGGERCRGMLIHVVWCLLAHHTSKAVTSHFFTVLGQGCVSANIPEQL